MNVYSIYSYKTFRMIILFFQNSHCWKGASFTCTKRQNCVDEGAWSEWSSWSACSSSCISGQVHPRKTRYRSCRPVTSHIDFYRSWIQNPTSDFACPGLPQESIGCSDLKACPNAFEWASWAEWTECKSCIKHRYRKCNFLATRSSHPAEIRNCLENLEGKADEAQGCACTEEDCPAGSEFIQGEVTNLFSLNYEYNTQ